MSKEYKPVGTKRCYACIQWSSERTVDKEKGIKVDANGEATCLIYHKKTKGSFYCDQYFPLR